MSLGRIFPAVVLGSVMLSLAWASGGCGAVQQFPAKRFARAHVPTQEGPVTFAPDAPQATVNRVALDGLPSGVQTNFYRDHPDAAVTVVEQVPTGTGVMLYRVMFMEDGAAGSALYRAGGREMNPPGPGYIIRHDDSGRPPAKFAPSTQPTQTGIEVLAPNQQQ